MAFSSYQVERLISHLKRWITGPFPGRSHVPDPVRTTPTRPRNGAPEGVAGDPPSSPGGGAGRAGAGRGGGLKAIAETRQYPAVVEAERERRAGIFMDPPYPESPEQIGIPRIPKLKRDVQPKWRTGAPLGDAD